MLPKFPVSLDNFVLIVFLDGGNFPHYFSVVEDTRFTTECESIVQHVCEEHYKVAVPKPVVVPVPIFSPVPALSRKRRSPVPSLSRHKRQLTLDDPDLLARQVKTPTLIPPPPTLSHQVLITIISRLTTLPNIVPVNRLTA